LWSALAIGSMYGPQLARWFTSWKIGRNAGAPDPEASSGVESSWLRMELDHSTGALDGLVLQGSYRGKRLSELEPNALADLLGTLRIEDGEGAQLLEAYLDRVHPEWRGSGGGQAEAAAPSEGPMSRAEAARLLGVAETASVEEIKAAHRRVGLPRRQDQPGESHVAAGLEQDRNLRPSAAYGMTGRVRALMCCEPFYFQRDE
jgi:hypothetical protein